MATRFYLQNSGAAPVSPSYSAGWEQNGEADRVKLERKAQTSLVSTLTDNALTIPITTTQDILNRQYVSEPLPAQTISGTFSLVVRCVETDTNANATLATLVYVVSNDGTVSRGTLFSVFGTDTEFGTTAATRIVNAAAITAQTAQFGDRIVVEIGLTATVPLALDGASQRFGTSAASDFALTSALTTDLNPWCEFSQDLWDTTLKANRRLRPAIFKPGLAR